jgi:ABC-type polysaccharide/polyol phosphate transport system ATPase subunit
MIKLEGVSKVFALPHERKRTLFHWASSILGKQYDYEPLYALNDINLHVKDGEFLGIIGKNGTGKSTLLKVISGIYPPSQGKVTVTADVFPMLELGVGFQPEFSVKENIYLYGTVLGFTRRELSGLLDAIIEYAGLQRFVDAKLGTLSLGMMLRLGFAVAIQSRASIFLVDEVLAVRDKDFAARCETQFAQFKQAGKTVVLVSHDLTSIQKFCERAILLENGRIVKEGQSEELVEFYSRSDPPVVLGE